MALGGEGDFTGKLRLPLPDTFSGNPADWEEWSWNFKAYIPMFETGAVTLLDAAEARNDEFLDDNLAVTLDTGDVDAEATAARVLFSRKLHYLLSQLVKDSAKLVVRQNEDSNGFETWRRLYKKFSLPGATRSTSLLTQLLDFKFNPSTFEQDFNVWETIKTRYERQAGQPLPDGVLVATLLNKTTGALQQHLRLNAQTLTTYAQVREVILEYHRSRLLMNPVAQTSANATFQGGASAPMDIGALAAALWKGKGKGKKGKGKGKGKDFSKSQGKGNNQHWNFMKGKGKGGKGKGKPTFSSTSVCWSCGKTGHFASNCPTYRVSAVDGDDQLWNDDQGDWTYFGESEDFSDWTEWAINAVSELYDSSWDQTWDDSLWSWESWDSWDPWGWSSDFTSEPWPAEAASSAKAETLKPKEEASSSSGAATLPVSAVTLEGPPGLSAAKAKPKPRRPSARALCSCRLLFLVTLVWVTLSGLMR